MLANELAPGALTAPRRGRQAMTPEHLRDREGGLVFVVTSPRTSRPAFTAPGPIWSPSGGCVIGRGRLVDVRRHAAADVTAGLY